MRELIKAVLTDAAHQFVRKAPVAVLNGGGHFTQLLSSPLNTTPPQANVRELLRLYQTSPWVFSIVNKLAENCAEPEFYLETRDGKQVFEHPVLDFIRSGSELLTSHQSLLVHYAYMELAAESFWLIGRDAANRPASWCPVPANWITDIRENDIGQRVFSLSPPNTKNPVDIPWSEMIWIKRPDPSNPLGRGASIVKAAYAEIEVDKAATNYLYWFLKNRARPDIVISGTQHAPLQDDDVKRLEELWLPRFQGPSNAGRPFFSANELKVESLQASMRDHQMVEARKYEAELLAQLWNMPPELLGRLENSNRATIDGADYLFQKHLVRPRNTLTSTTLYRRLLPEFPDLQNYKLRQVNPVQEDKELQVKLIVAAPWHATVDEIRKIGGLPPLGGKEGEERRPILADNQSASTGTTTTGTNQKPQGTGKKAVTRKMTAPVKNKIVETITLPSAYDDSDKIALVQEFEDQMNVYGRDLADEYNVYWEISPDTALWLSASVNEMIDTIDKTTAEQLRQALDELPDESSVQDVALAVTNVFERADKQRAVIISETEMSAVAGFAAIQVLRQANMLEKVWRTVGDAKVRHAHAAMDGQKRYTNEPFVAPGGQTALYPCGFADPALNCNCRCWVTTEQSKRTEAQHNALIDVMAAAVMIEIKARFDRQREAALAVVADLITEDEQ